MMHSIFEVLSVMHLSYLFVAPSVAITLFDINGVFSEASFPTCRGIEQGCPSSGSVWANLFDPVVRRLLALALAHRSAI